MGEFADFLSKDGSLAVEPFPWQLERNEKMKVHLGHRKKSLLTQCPWKPHSVVKWCIWSHLHQNFIPTWCRICLHWWIFVVKILPSGDSWGLLSRWRSGCKGCPTLQNGGDHHVNPKGVLGSETSPNMKVGDVFWTPELSRMIIYIIYLECQQLRS